MDTKTRIKTILLLEKIKADPIYANRITVKDASYFRKYKRLQR